MGGSITARRSEDIAREDGSASFIGARVSLSAEESYEDPELEPAWCVERGTALAAMTTGTLIESVNSGELDANTRVWREGLECWTRIIDVPELAFAFGAIDPESPTATGTTPLAVEIASPSAPDTLPSAEWRASWGPVAPVPRGVAVRREAREHASSADFRAAPTVPAAALRLDSVDQDERPTVPVPEPMYAPSAWELREASLREASLREASLRPAPLRKHTSAPPPPPQKRSSITRADVLWIGGGFAVALTAIGLALMTAAFPASAQPGAQPVGRASTYPFAAEEAGRAAVTAIKNAEGARKNIEARATLSRADPGQRRLRGRSVAPVAPAAR